MSSIITRDYQGHAIAYQGDGWFNATQAAAKYGKEPRDLLRLHETCLYIEAFAKARGIPFHPVFAQRKASEKVTGGNSGFRPELKSVEGLIKVKRGSSLSGGGTWLHPKLAVHFARWLDPRFAVWCDEQIDALVRGRDDWRKLRHQSASSCKVLNEVLRLVRQDSGKATEPHHYINESRLVNWAICGEFKGLDRDRLSAAELALLAFLEQRNAVLIGRGLSYDQRKPMLKQYAMDWQLDRLAIDGEAAA